MKREVTTGRGDDPPLCVTVMGQWVLRWGEFLVAVARARRPAVMMNSEAVGSLNWDRVAAGKARGHTAVVAVGT
jgi:hypothetical protein